MTVFKKGDRVICVDAGTGNFLEEGREYVVHRAWDDGNTALVQVPTNKGISQFWATRFVPVATPPVTLNPDEWAWEAVHDATRPQDWLSVAQCIIAWAKFCWWVTGARIVWRPEPEPDLIPVLLERADVEKWGSCNIRSSRWSACDLATIEACRQALAEEQGR